MQCSGTNMQTQIFASVGVMVTLAAISPAIATEVRNAGWQPGPCGDQYQRSGSADVSKHYTANSDATYRNCERKDDFNQYADDSRPCPTVANKVVSKTAGLGVFTHQSSGTAARNLIKTVEDSGGWRQPESRLRDREKFDSPFCNIERISVLDLTPERFEREYRFKKPVLLTFPRGAVDWTVPDKWKRAELKRTFGEWEVTLYDSVGFYGKLARRKAHLADFIDSMRQYNGPKNADDMVFDLKFLKKTGLVTALKLPSDIFRDFHWSENTVYLSLGAAGSGLMFHQHTDTLAGVVFGKKRWFLYPLTRNPPGGVYNGLLIMEWYKRIYPNLTLQDRPLECIQQAGELIYLPEGTYHATINVGDTIGVAIQRNQPTLQVEKLIRQVNRLTIARAKAELDNSTKASYGVKILDIRRQLVRSLPGNTEMLVKLAACYMALGKYNKTLALLKKATNIDPYFVMAYVESGHALIQLKRFEEAEDAFVRALRLVPSLWRANADYAEFLWSKGRLQEALPFLERMTQIRPDLLSVWDVLQQTQQILGDKEGAIVTKTQIDRLMKNSTSAR